MKQSPVLKSLLYAVQGALVGIGAIPPGVSGLMSTLNGLIQRAYAEEGYVEKASAIALDSKLANKGSANYTKYARDIDNLGLMGCQGQAWCCTHQFWLEVQEFGVDKALEH